MGCVYKLVLSNGKAYVGYTRGTLAARVAGHLKFAKGGSKLAFHRAIRIHGAPAQVVVLFESEDEDALLDFEVRSIKLHDTLVPNGYNLTNGGERSWSHHPETRRAMSEKMMGRKIRLGMKHSTESKELMSELKRGRKLSEETKRKMKESRKAFYRSEENLARLKEERRARCPDPFLRKIRMGCLSAVGHAKRAGIPFSELKP